MSDDLLNNHPLEGRTVTELEELLGEPDDTDTTLSIKTWYLDLGWTALFHMDVHIDSTTATVDSVRAGIDPASGVIPIPGCPIF